MYTNIGAFHINIQMNMNMNMIKDLAHSMVVIPRLLLFVLMCVRVSIGYFSLAFIQSININGMHLKLGVCG